MITRTTTAVVMAAALGHACLTSCNASSTNVGTPGQAPSDRLPSWRDGATKHAIVDFIARVTTPGGPDHVVPGDRIAVFDNDGTLWTEQPTYNQLAFAMARVRALAPAHPGWRTEEPFRSVLADDQAGLAAQGERGLAKLLAATHAGMTTDEFAALVRDWIASARHPVTGRRYTEMVYQPMLELLAYLSDRGFTVFIVSGGGVEFMRPWTERVYGVPPERVIGSRAKLVYEVREGGPVLVRQPAIELVDDKAGKPVGIHQQIGRRPIAAFGNSDGDFEMLEWTTSAPGPRLGLIVHHTDGAREWAYGRASPVGGLERALAQAPARGWIVVDMKRDWRRIYPGTTPCEVLPRGVCNDKHQEQARSAEHPGDLGR